jgi:hypothetical protein
MTDQEQEVAPDPSALIESMRAFGYALPTAVADLIDNSISAGAVSIPIDFRWAGAESSLAVVDDGRGMDEPTLVEAMRLGSRSPVESRAKSDLGRFGLGLKSAAWSQGRSLTVLTKQDGGPILTRRWDLDHVTETGRWFLLRDGTPVAEEFAALLDRAGRGTAVLIERLDRLVGAVDEADSEPARQRFYDGVGRTQRHVAMVFHRFLTGRSAIAMTINGNAVEPWDPFLEGHTATQRLPAEHFSAGSDAVEVLPFVLPHVSKLSPTAHADAAGPNGWNAQQGFYVYRAKRLLVAGGWLGLRRMQQEEHYKLARIRIDLENTADEQWQIDVRKATARIPGPLVDSFERVAKRVRREASEAYRFRGKVLARRAGQPTAIDFVWDHSVRRGGGRGFRVNRKHPVVVALASGPPEVRRAVERIMRLIEENLPLESIRIESLERPDEVPPDPFADEQVAVREMLQDVHLAMVDGGSDPRDALAQLARTEPFTSHAAVIEAFREEHSL